MKISDTLVSAAEVIVKEGLVAGYRHAPNGGVCALGAIETALAIEPHTGGPEFDAAVTVLDSAIPVAARQRMSGWPVDTSRVAHYSNTTDPATVVAWFLRAAVEHYTGDSVAAEESLVNG